MSLGSGWFDGTGSPNYEDVKCEYDFSSASMSSSTSGSFIKYEYSPCGWLVFLPNKQGDSSKNNVLDPEYGYVYAEDDSTGNKIRVRHIYHSFRSAPATSRLTMEYLRRPFGYYTGPGGTKLILVHPTGGSRTCSVFIYQPFSWYGRVGQVIAAILLSRGLNDAYIDQDAFSDADDGQAAMGTSDDEEPFVFYRRQLNQTLADAIKELARHSWDLLTINMGGKIALTRRVGTSAAFTVSALDKSDGVVSVQMRYAYEMLANYAYASEGRYYDVLTEDLASSHSDVVASCSEVGFPAQTLENSELPFEEFTDAASVTKYGKRALGPETDIQEGSEVKRIRYYHLPYLCNIEGSSGDPMAAKAVLMSRLADVESVLRREVTVVQDLRGLDYDVGWKVASVAVTEDGQTISDTRCVKKVIDFNDLSVTSTLLEEPS